MYFELEFALHSDGVAMCYIIALDRTKTTAAKAACEYAIVIRPPIVLRLFHSWVVSRRGFDRVFPFFIPQFRREFAEVMTGLSVSHIVIKSEWPRYD